MVVFTASIRTAITAIANIDIIIITIRIIMDIIGIGSSRDFLILGKFWLSRVTVEWWGEVCFQSYFCL